MHIHTHYDNLQLPQNASDADIRQAYRRLSRKYHPDLNPDPDAHRIMQLVNKAYDVLSDPQRRAEHDYWIEAQRRRKQLENSRPQSITYSSQYYPRYQPSSAQKTVLWGLVLISLVMLGLLALHSKERFFNETPPQSTESNTIIVQTQTPTETLSNHPNDTENEVADDYVRPETAPNGSKWPNASGYVSGYPMITGMGKSSINVENIRNSSDVFVQLYEKNSTQAVRSFFITERSEFLLNQLDAGEYFVRYYQLDSGDYLDSESVTLKRNQQATIYLQRSAQPKR